MEEGWKEGDGEGGGGRGKLYSGVKIRPINNNNRIHTRFSQSTEFHRLQICLGKVCSLPVGSLSTHQYVYTIHTYSHKHFFKCMCTITLVTSARGNWAP